MSVGAPSRFAVVARVGVAQLIGYGGTYYMPAILAAPIGRELGIAPAWTLGGLSLGLIVSSIMGPAVGRRVDGGGARNALVAANLTFALGLVLLSLSHGLPMMTAAWLCMGLGMGLGYYETAFAALTRLYGMGARNLISGVTLIAGFTSTVSWPLTALFEAQYGWRATCLMWAAANLLVALPLNLLLPGDVAERRSASAAAMKETPPPAEDSAMRRDMVAIAVMFAATSFVSSGLSAVMPTLLLQLGVGATAAIAASALVGPSQIVGRLAELGFLRRLHPATTARIAALFHPLGVAALIAGGAAFSTPFVLLYGLGNGILTITRGTLPLAVFGPAGYGHRIGVLSAPGRITGALAPVGLGLLFDAIGPAGLYVTAGLNLAGFAALLFVTRRRGD